MTRGMAAFRIQNKTVKNPGSVLDTSYNGHTMAAIILETTKAVGEFLLGAVHDTVGAVATGVWNFPHRLEANTRYIAGVDCVLDEGRPWSKMGLGYSTSFWAGDNGLNRLAECFNDTVLSVLLGGINTVTMGLTYNGVNEGLGIDCPYFVPGPNTWRESGQFFSRGVMIMLMGRQLTAPRASLMPRMVTTKIELPPVAQGKFTSYYAAENPLQEIAAHIRSGNRAAPAVLKKLLDVRMPATLDAATQTLVQLVGEGHLPIQFLEKLLWETHPRLQPLMQHLQRMRFDYPRLNTLWDQLKLDSYELCVLPRGEVQLRPTPMPPTQLNY